MRKEIEILDILSVLSFYIGLINLDENLSQGKAGDMLQQAVEEIHDHLNAQDQKINKILEELQK